MTRTPPNFTSYLKEAVAHFVSSNSSITRLAVAQTAFLNASYGNTNRTFYTEWAAYEQGASKDQRKQGVRLASSFVQLLEPRDRQRLYTCALRVANILIDAHKQAKRREQTDKRNTLKPSRQQMLKETKESAPATQLSERRVGMITEPASLPRLQRQMRPNNTDSVHESLTAAASAYPGFRMAELPATKRSPSMVVRKQHQAQKPQMREPSSVVYQAGKAGLRPVSSLHPAERNPTGYLLRNLAKTAHDLHREAHSGGRTSPPYYNQLKRRRSSALQPLRPHQSSTHNIH